MNYCVSEIVSSSSIKLLYLHVDIFDCELFVFQPFCRGAKCREPFVVELVSLVRGIINKKTTNNTEVVSTQSLSVAPFPTTIPSAKTSQSGSELPDFCIIEGS